MLNREVARQALWITWEVQRRNGSLSRELDIDFYELESDKPRWVRYLILSVKTLTILIKKSPRLVFVQNPSVVLALLTTVYGKLFGINVVIDAHNAGVYPPKFLGWTARMYRHCARTIVTNKALARDIAAIGGSPIILPDPLPELNQGPVITLPGVSILYICTWADDEPFLEVINSGNFLDSSYHIYISGNFKKCKELVSLEIPENVKLLGFISAEEFDSYLASVDIVVDLTTLDNCLVCGAYEAIAAKKPLLLSDTKALRDYFGEAACYTDNSFKDIAHKLREMGDNLPVYRKNSRALKADIDNRWRALFNSSCEDIESLS